MLRPVQVACRGVIFGLVQVWKASRERPCNDHPKPRGQPPCNPHYELPSLLADKVDRIKLTNGGGYRCMFVVDLGVVFTQKSQNQICSYTQWMASIV